MIAVRSTAQETLTQRASAIPECEVKTVFRIEIKRADRLTGNERHGRESLEEKLSISHGRVHN